ncbi:MAG: hypothetical protein JST54_06890 [Deltaproteobacteria bacterium]|nr:hypothetical protein [Deltaproteobacteria bacterium]
MKIRAFVGMVVLGSSAWLSAFAASGPPRSGAASITAETTGGICPFAVPGTRVVTSKVEGGAALDFTTHKGGVAELRRRVAAVAERHNALHDLGGTAVASRSNAPGHGVSGGEVPPMNSAKASVEDIDGGARVILTPQDPSQLQVLRQHVESRVALMYRQGCPVTRRATPAPNP